MDHSKHQTIYFRWIGATENRQATESSHLNLLTLWTLKINKVWKGCRPLADLRSSSISFKRSLKFNYCWTGSLTLMRFLSWFWWKSINLYRLSACSKFLTSNISQAEALSISTLAWAGNKKHPSTQLKYKIQFCKKTSSTAKSVQLASTTCQHWMKVSCASRRHSFLYLTYFATHLVDATHHTQMQQLSLVLLL